MAEKIWRMPWSRPVVGRGKVPAIMLMPLRRSTIVVERYVKMPRAWILTRGAEDQGGSVGMTARGRLIMSGKDGYSLGDEEALNVLSIEPVCEARGDQSEVGVMAVVIPGELYAWIEEMDAKRRGALPTEKDDPQLEQVEMWASEMSNP